MPVRSDGSAIGRMIATKAAVHIVDVRAEQSYIERNPHSVAAANLGGVRSFLAVPMLKENRREAAVPLVSGFACLISGRPKSRATFTVKADDPETAVSRIIALVNLRAREPAWRRPLRGLSEHFGEPHHRHGFGGKQDYDEILAAAYCAKEVGRPVKLIQTRESTFATSFPRTPTRPRRSRGRPLSGFLPREDQQYHLPLQCLFAAASVFCSSLLLRRRMSALAVSQ
jgi:Molybdopterin-binding domain of aldehyde dehydrogenase